MSLPLSQGATAAQSGYKLVVALAVVLNMIIFRNYCVLVRGNMSPPAWESSKAEFPFHHHPPPAAALPPPTALPPTPPTSAPPAPPPAASPSLMTPSHPYTLVMLTDTHVGFRGRPAPRAQLTVG